MHANELIPDSIRIGGHDIRVVKDFVFKERQDINAQFSATDDEIRIASNDGCGPFSDDYIMQLFMHEIVHAVLAIYNGQQIEEQVIVSLGEGLYQVMKDNNLCFNPAKT